MKIIDLLNKIANGEEVPKVVKYNGILYWYDETDDNEIARYRNYDEEWLFNDCYLNDEVEIIEEKPTEEEVKKYTNKFLEVWGPINKQFEKLFDEVVRINTKLGLNFQEDLKEDSKKINTIDCWYSMEDIKNNPELYNIMFTELKDKINEIIDKLNEEGKK